MSSTDPMNKQTVRTTCFVHQRRTRANVPIDQENKEPITPKAIPPCTRPRRNTKRRLPLRRSTRINQGGRTSAKTISTKKLTHLLNVQVAKDKKFLQQQAVNEQMKELIPKTETGDDRFVEYNIPTPKGAPPLISQDKDDEPPSNNRFVAPPRNTTAHNIRPACISQEAVNSVLVQAMLNATQVFIPRRMEDNPFAFDAPVDIAEMADGVVHPTTKERLTKYQQVIEVPELSELWMKAMCIRED